MEDMDELGKKLADQVYFEANAPGMARSYMVLEAAHRLAAAFPYPVDSGTFRVWSTREACVAAYVSTLKAETPLKEDQTLVLQALVMLMLIEDKSGLFLGVARRMFPQYRFKWKVLRGRYADVGRKAPEEVKS